MFRLAPSERRAPPRGRIIHVVRSAPMRTAMTLAAFGLLGLCGAAQACGDTAEVSAPSVPDSGITPEAAPPAIVEASVDSAKCDLAHDLLDDIPDASLDGATTGACAACARAKCAARIDACNQSCECQSLASNGLACIARNPSNPLACIAPFLGASPEIRDLGTSLLVCLQTGCGDACGQTIDPPEDAGVDASDAGDASLDAADADADAASN